MAQRTGLTGHVRKVEHPPVGAGDDDEWGRITRGRGAPGPLQPIELGLESSGEAYLVGTFRLLYEKIP